MDLFFKKDKEEDKKAQKPEPTEEPQQVSKEDDFEARKRAFKSIRNAFGQK